MPKGVRNDKFNKKGKRVLRPRIAAESTSRSKAEPRSKFSKRALGNIGWIEKHCRIPEGKFVGQPLVMADFMKEDFNAIYRDENDPRGPVRRAIITRGRKNAKSVECACIVLLHLCGPEAEHRVNSQLYSTAQSREQAALIFNLASKMIRMNVDMNSQIIIKDAAKELHFPALGTKYKALSAEVPTAFGLSPVLTIHDELGQVRGERSQLYEALETATGAQESPLTVIISTQAPTDADLLSILVDDAKREEDPRTVLRINSAPDGIDPLTVEAIRAANPAFDLFMNKQEVLGMMEDARRMPSRQNEFENLVLNRRVESNSPFITQQLWKNCSAEPMNLHGLPVYGGLDLSEVRDLTALVLIGRKSSKDVWNVEPTFWLPDQNLEAKARADRVPYDRWKREGLLQTTPGASVSYEYVAEYMFKMFERFNIRKIGFDRWNMKHLHPWLINAGFSEAMIAEKFVEFGQGTQSMSPALRELEAAIAERQIAHGNHPVLTMCMANAVVEGKDSANRKLSKSRSSGRIDGAVALAMAFGVAPVKGTVFDVTAMIA